MPNCSSYLPTTNKNCPSFFPNTASSPTHQPNSFTSQNSPYISKCLLCDQQGHFAKCEREREGEKERRGMCLYVCMREKNNLAIPNTKRIHNHSQINYTLVLDLFCILVLKLLLLALLFKDLFVLMIFLQLSCVRLAVFNLPSQQ